MYERETEEMKGRLREYVEQVAQKSGKAKGMYNCPLCGSGTGTHKTGAFSVTSDGQRWKCFACGEGGDVFDLIGRIERLADFVQQRKRAAEIFGITLEEKKHFTREELDREFTDPDELPEQPAGAHKKESNYSDFFLQANADLEGAREYLTSRGISFETANKFGLGYVEQWRHPKAPAAAPTSPRLIIPTGKGSYLARDIRAIIPERQKEYAKSKAGTLQIFNAAALAATDQPVFVVEGELDALSIIEVGGQAVALGTTTAINKFMREVSKYKPKQPLIIAMDNDPSGEKAAAEISQKLEIEGIEHYCYNPYQEQKDANDALIKDRSALREEVANIGRVITAENEKEKSAYQEQNSAAAHLQNFVNGIAASANTPAQPTGFYPLDSVLDGGLYEGLYIVGAISSLGKTTLVLQIADQIAQAGNDVLIISLEMSRNELISKSISRHSMLKSLDQYNHTRYAKTSRGITAGSLWARYTDEEKKVIGEAIQSYGEYAKHLYIYEGIGDIGAAKVRKLVEQHKRVTGKAPTVIIDYLQILAPYDVRASDKQNTDQAVTELKRVSRDFKIPVIGISSFNRQNYSEKVNFAAFKESGAIEYSSDVLIGLQLKGAGDKNFDVDKAKQENPRKVELIILKNRNGKTGTRIDFAYYPLFNFFEAK